MTNKAQHGMQKREKKLFSGSETMFEVQAWPKQSSINRISDRSVITEAFYARFLTYFTSEGDGKDIRNRASWFHRLPYFAVDGTNEALTLAVESTALSYCAVQTQNPALQRHARDLYGRAMQNHGRFLARSRTGKDAVTIHMISTSVLFSFFEAMQATNVDAYCSHIYGAAKMFEVTDPRQCTEGVLCQIFYHIRTQMAFAQLTSQGKQTPVDVKKILYNALDYEELPVFQRLVTHFTRLADVYSKVNVSNKQGYMEDADAQMISTAVEDLWDEYEAASALDDEQLTWYDDLHGTMEYRDAFTALVCAYFSASRILLAIVAPSITVPVPDSTNHHQNILNVAHYLETHLIGCAYMRMAAPLLLVTLYAPKMGQRKRAFDYFQHWEDNQGLRGITTLVVDCMYRYMGMRALREKE
ncbi:hypothetical protein EK21DRAFT_68309 [Setomelanomma holmii]|uniref:Uncharacterized protein n=1 Tax=Setomelanomma holmii TaxID=210430 RepID=A0A9P4H8K5_9PLEO|nr:hypothetical protein EK21DRAFT_68309 [Setomelanomma holmii]